MESQWKVSGQLPVGWGSALVGPDLSCLSPEVWGVQSDHTEHSMESERMPAGLWHLSTRYTSVGYGHASTPLERANTSGRVLSGGRLEAGWNAGGWWWRGWRWVPVGKPQWDATREMVRASGSGLKLGMESRLEISLQWKWQRRARRAVPLGGRDWRACPNPNRTSWCGLCASLVPQRGSVGQWRQSRDVALVGYREGRVSKRARNASWNDLVP